MGSKRTSFLLRTSCLSTVVFTTVLLVAVPMALLCPQRCDHVAVEAFAVTPQNHHGPSSSMTMRTARSSTNLRISSSTVLSMASGGGDDEDDGDDGDEETPTQMDSAPTQMQRDFPVRKEEPDPDQVWRTLGLDRAAIIMPIVLLINIWFFTVPPEFRRARLCSEMDTAAYPEQCMTPKMFASGIVDYYKGGGGIQWDFSIAEDNPFVAPKSE